MATVGGRRTRSESADDDDFRSDVVRRCRRPSDVVSTTCLSSSPSLNALKRYANSLVTVTWLDFSDLKFVTVLCGNGLSTSVIKVYLYLPVYLCICTGVPWHSCSVFFGLLALLSLVCFSLSRLSDYLDWHRWPALMELIVNALFGSLP